MHVTCPEKLSSRQSTGFSLVEVIISTAILLIIMSAIAYLVQNSLKTSKKISSSSTCEQTAQTLVSQLQAGEPNLQVRNFVPSIGATGNQLKPDSVHYSRPIAEKIGGKWQFFTHQLNENIIHQIMATASKSGFCGTEAEFKLTDPTNLSPSSFGGDITLSGLFDNTILPNNTKAYLKIFLSEPMNNPRNGQNAGFWCPNSTPDQKEYYPNTSTILYVRIIVEKQEPDGNAHRCLAQNKIQYHADTSRPRVQLTSFINGKSINLNSEVSCGNDPNSSYDNLNPKTVSPILARTVSYKIQGSESGQIFVCSANGNLWGPCWLPNEWLTPVVPGASLTKFQRASGVSEYNQPNAIEMTIVWPNDGKYTVSVDSLDSSADPKNWASGAGQPAIGGGGISAEAEIDLFRPNISEINFTGTLPPVKPGFAPNSQFLCSLQPVRASITIDRGIGVNHDNESCAMFVQRTPSSGRVNSMYNYVEDNNPNGCGSFTIDTTMISGILSVYNVTGITMTLGTDVFSGRSYTKSDVFGNLGGAYLYYANVSIGAQIRDSCNDNSCAAVPGGVGPTDLFWKNCFGGASTRLTSAAANSYSTRAFEVNLNDSRLNQTKMSYFSETYPDRFRSEFATAQWETQFANVNLNSINVVSPSAPEFILHYKNFSSGDNEYKSSRGYATAEQNINSFNTGCSSNNVQFELYSGCTGHGGRVSRVSNVLPYKVNRETGQTCVDEPCEGDVSQIACNKTGRCEGLPLSTTYFGPNEFLSFQTFSDSNSCNSDCVNAFSSNWNVSCIKTPSDTTTLNSCLFSGVSNTDSSRSEGQCRNLALGLAPQNPTANPITLPTPKPFDPVILNCEQFFTNPTQLIQQDGSQSNVPPSSGCGCMSLCFRDSVEGREMPDDCKFSTQHPPSPAIDYNWVSSSLDDEGQPIHCADYYLVDYTQNKDTSLECAQNSKCQQDYGMLPITNDLINSWMGQQGEASGLCALYLNTAQVMAGLGGSGQPNCVNQVNEAANALRQNSQFCDLNSNTLNAYNPNYPAPGPTPVLGTRTGFCVPWP